MYVYVCILERERIEGGREGRRGGERETQRD